MELAKRLDGLESGSAGEADVWHQAVKLQLRRRQAMSDGAGTAQAKGGKRCV